MASQSAKLVALKVAENIRKGKRVDMGKIIREVGYAKSVSKSPDRVTHTQSYKDTIEPFVQQLIKKRQQYLDAITEDKIEKTQAANLTTMVDIFTKNIQLLSGKETERQGITIELSEAVAKKYDTNAGTKSDSE